MSRTKNDIAVSIHFDPSRMRAPQVSALAERLRVSDMIRLARRYGIPLEENTALAEQLSELGEQSEVPEEFYEEVAALLTRFGSSR